MVCNWFLPWFDYSGAIDQSVHLFPQLLHLVSCPDASSFISVPVSASLSIYIFQIGVRRPAWSSFHLHFRCEASRSCAKDAHLGDSRLMELVRDSDTSSFSPYIALNPISIRSCRFSFKRESYGITLPPEVSPLSLLISSEVAFKTPSLRPVM